MEMVRDEIYCANCFKNPIKRHINMTHTNSVCTSCFCTEPLYMRQNPAQYFFNTKADCCEVSLTNHTLYLICQSICIQQKQRRNISYDQISQEHYDWNQSKCMGTAASTNTGTGRYYPDWLGDDTCKNDGSAPEYMTLNPTMWLHDNLSDCCKVCFVCVNL